MSSDLQQSLNKRRTFAIVSHPDAGKTTLTEKLLLYGGAIQVAGSVKSRKSSRHATSDWMALEQQRGISVTTSVMQFDYSGAVINLLDTPGHADFSEDTYRTLTAVDSALMVIDAAKGVEARTIKLLDVCRMRKTPIMTFINKLDRETRPPIELLDEIESVLGIHCAPITWPIGMGKAFRGVYHLKKDQVLLFNRELKNTVESVIDGLDSQAVKDLLGVDYQEFVDEIELVKEASYQFDQDSYLSGELTPVFFGSAMNNFGIRALLDDFVQYAPVPQPRETLTRIVEPQEAKLTGFIFKIQANMDPAHRDRIAFMRVCSGHFTKGMKLRQVRTKKDVTISNPLTFLASAREQLAEAWPGDIIGIHNHGSIQIGDSFTQGEALQFTGIPNFAPELFRLVVLKDPLKSKALLKGLQQLSEEGATQLFKPINNNQLILGAVGILQFDVVAHRLKHEYGVECAYETVSVVAARWVNADDDKDLAEFKASVSRQLAIDGSGCLTYLAQSRVNLNLTMERWPKISFRDTREILV